MPNERARGANGRFMKKAEGGDTARRIRREIAAEVTTGGITPSNDPGEAAIDQALVSRTAGPEYQEAQERARAGDDSMLLPYAPTPSINPPRPRTVAAGYNRDQQVLTIRFREGAVYDYYNVPPSVWGNFRRVKSPGRFVSRVLNTYSYGRRTDLEG